MKGIFKLILASFLYISAIYARVVINEVNFYPQTWIELYNPTPYNINLSNFKIAIPEGIFDLEGVDIKPNSYLLISKERLFPKDNITLNIQLSNSGGYVILIEGSSTIDFVNWGLILPEWKSAYPFLWDNPPDADMNLSRIPDGYDTNNPEDFTNTETPTPLSPNAPMGLAPASWSRIKALFRDAHKRM